MVLVKFETNNDSFVDMREKEIAKILRNLAEDIENGATYGKVIDSNGNMIGEWETE